jgi:hypothetical protein
MYVWNPEDVKVEATRSPKRWWPFTNLHGVTSLKTLHFTLAALRTSSLTEMTRLVVQSIEKNWRDSGWYKFKGRTFGFEGVRKTSPAGEMN